MSEPVIQCKNNYLAESKIFSKISYLLSQLFLHYITSQDIPERLVCLSYIRSVKYNFKQSSYFKSRPTINTGRSTKNVTWSKGTVIYSDDATKILKNKNSYTKLYDSLTSFKISQCSRFSLSFSVQQQVTPKSKRTSLFKIKILRLYNYFSKKLVVRVE